MADAAPLAGLRVVFCAAGVAAAYAARLLGTMGAETILLEPPGGTPLRREPPFLESDPTGSEQLFPGAGRGPVSQRLQLDPGLRRGTDSKDTMDSVSALFAYLAAGSRSVVADLDSAEGRTAATALLSGADIFIDDTPLADREGKGLDEGSIARRHPDLIHVSVLPFGAYGPKAGWKAEEINILHASGEGNLLPNGLSIELFPDRPPVKIYGHFASLQGGIAAALGALSALWARPDVGGQYVDIASQDATLAVGAFAIQRFGDGQVEHRVERSFRYGGVLPCADGHVELLTLEQRQWEGLVDLIGRPEWALDPALSDSLERSRRGAAINAHIRAWAKNRRVADVVAEGQAVGVPLAPYNSPADVLRDPHERQRGLFAPVAIEGAGMLDMLVAPFQFGGEAAALKGGPPALGDYGQIAAEHAA